MLCAVAGAFPGTKIMFGITTKGNGPSTTKSRYHRPATLASLSTERMAASFSPSAAIRAQVAKVSRKRVASKRALILQNHGGLAALSGIGPRARHHAAAPSD